MTLDVYKKKDPYSYDSVKKAQAEKEKYNTYNQSESVVNAYNTRTEANSNLQNHLNSWDEEVMSKDYLEKYNALQNRPDFSYDVNGDALYQQYKDQYINQGRLAMMDTMGQAAAMTGGYGNSYAASVGNQAYQGYLQKLNEVVPDLYNMAYNMYMNEGEDLKYAYETAKNIYDTNYGHWADKTGILQSEASRADSNYYNEANLDWTMFNDKKTSAIDEFNTALDRAINQENTNYSDYLARLEATNADKTKELAAMYAGWINPDEDVDVDPETNEITAIKGYKLAGSAGSTGSAGIVDDATITGFNGKSGDNFTIKRGDKKYNLENEGEVDDDDLIKQLDKSGAKEMQIVTYNGNAYVRYSGKYYKLGNQETWFGLGNNGNYSNLLKAIL
jgi:hypothetical protein